MRDRLFGSPKLLLHWNDTFMVSNTKITKSPLERGWHTRHEYTLLDDIGKPGATKITQRDPASS
jgi:hypothetical protein